MPVSRKYRCSDCDYEWSKLHWDRDEYEVDCPRCLEAKAQNVPGTFAIATNRSKAIDTTQQILESEQGMTNIRDNQRGGDLAAPGVAPMQTAEREALQREINAVTEAQKAKTDAANAGTIMPWAQAGAGGVFEGGARQAASEAQSKGLDAVSLAKRAPGGGGPSGMPLRIIGADRVT